MSIQSAREFLRNVFENEEVEIDFENCLVHEDEFNSIVEGYGYEFSRREWGLVLSEMFNAEMPEEDISEVAGSRGNFFNGHTITNQYPACD